MFLLQDSQLFLTWPVPEPWLCVSPPALPASASADPFPASGLLSAPSPRPADCEETCQTHEADHNFASLVDRKMLPYPTTFRQITC